MEDLLKQILHDIHKMNADISSIKTDVSSLKTDVTSLKTDVSSIKTDVTSLKTDVTSLKTDVTSLKNDVASLNTEISSMKTDINFLKSDVDSLKLEMHGRFNEIKNDIEASHIENIKSDELILKTLLEHKAAINEELVTYEHQFKVINNELFRVKADVDRLKSK